jgi:hypothetical protein
LRSSRPRLERRQDFVVEGRNKIGPVTFDLADYDVDSDVLYLHVGEPREADEEETPASAAI